MGRVWNKSDHSHREDNEAREIEEVRPLVSHRYTLVQVVNTTSGVVTIVSIVNRPRQARCLKNGPFKPYSRCSRSFLLPFSFSAASGGLATMKARQRRLPTYWRSRPSEVTPDTSNFHKQWTSFCLPPATPRCYLSSVNRNIFYVIGVIVVIVVILRCSPKNAASAAESCPARP